MNRVVCFGEIMLRLTAPEGEVLLQSPRLNVFYAGSEASIAVSLARFGRPARWVSVLPDSRPGRAASDELRRWGVDVEAAAYTPGRMGLIYATPGAVLRPSEILYDRAGSAFAVAGPDAVDWDAALDGAGWLHVSGITPAVSPQGEAAVLRAVEIAVERGVRISFDGNFRPSLWAARGVEPGPIERRLMQHATLAFVEERDIGRVLGRAFDGADPETRREAAVAAAFEAFGALRWIAHTLRETHSVDDQSLSAAVRTREGEHHAGPYRLTGVVDRIGGGDAFAAGVLHVLADDGEPAEAAAFGLAATALKHGIRGDLNLSGEADVRALMAGSGLDVRR
jgi:2-dehydro-3-deoxygluconokinase